MPEQENKPKSLQNPKFAAETIEVLILHDSLSAAETIAGILTKVPFAVNWQQTATKKDYRARLSPQLDLILYNADLAQLTLTEAINLLAENNLNIPLLVINGASSIPAAVAAIEAGAIDYLTSKELERLPTAVAKALAKNSFSCLQLSRFQAETEQQLQKLITDNPDGIIVVNEQGIVRFVNPAALQLLGKSSEELIGESLGFLVVNGDYLEVDIPQSPEQILVAQMRVSQIQWRGANAYLVSLRDITQLKQAEEERAKLLAEAQAANRAKDEFLAVLSHELRTPLNPIVGWSQLLLSGTLSEEQSTKAIETIQRNAMLQAQLIGDILDISRIIRGKLKLQAIPVNLTMIINNALDTVTLSAIAKSIQIDTHLDENVGLVRGDPTRLQQVVWNLLSNAIKFTPRGGRVEVRLDSYEFSVLSSQLKENSSIQNSKLNPQHSQSFAQIQVSDTGKGIAPEFLPYVFDYFRQAETARTRAEGGLGLGLAIVRHLVELHGGTINVTSPGLGKGATFKLSLPMLSSQNESAREHSSSKHSSNLEGIKVLVVDDDNSSRDLLVFILENEGAEIRATASATEALAIIEQFQPNILVSDIAMPDMDGYELIQRVRELSPSPGGNFTAIALSAHASELDRQKSLAAKFDCHINKPIDIANFIEVLTQLANTGS